jgi:hypothetical protein
MAEIEALGFPARLVHALAREGITGREELEKLVKSGELYLWPGIGIGTIRAAAASLSIDPDALRWRRGIPVFEWRIGVGGAS